MPTTASILGAGGVPGILWQEHAKVTWIAFEAPGGIHHCILEICLCTNEMILPSAEVRLVK